MKFTHRHPAEWTFDPDRTYEQNDPWTKPRGFWLSVDGDWERWLAAEDLIDEHDRGGVSTTEFALDGSRCLWLVGASAIDHFDETYVVANTPPQRWDGRPDRYRINWAPLAEQYAGIVIAPYCWERRLQGDASGWYYPWDVASACVWDLSAVTALVDVRS